MGFEVFRVCTICYVISYEMFYSEMQMMNESVIGRDASTYLKDIAA